MIGTESGKVVGYAVRSKTCKMCERAEAGKYIAQEHDCRKNWTGSAKGMEPDMVLEMVEKAEENGVHVGTIIGDEDTTTIARLKANFDKDIQKLSDSNHIKKLLGNMLYSLKTTNKTLSVKIITYLKKMFNYMLAQSKGNPDMVKQGLLAIPRHVFGDHQHCGQWCRVQQEPSKKYIYKSLPHGQPLKDEKLKYSLTEVFSTYLRHCDKLAQLGSSQSNESLNKTIASKAPKMLHYSGSGSLNYRVAASIAQKNMGQKYIIAVSWSLPLKLYFYCLSFHCCFLNERLL